MGHFRNKQEKRAAYLARRQNAGLARKMVKKAANREDSKSLSSFVWKRKQQKMCVLLYIVSMICLCFRCRAQFRMEVSPARMNIGLVVRNRLCSQSVGMMKFRNLSALTIIGLCGKQSETA